MSRWSTAAWIAAHGVAFVVGLWAGVTLILYFFG